MFTPNKSPLYSILFSAMLLFNLFGSAADQNQVATTNDSVISRVFKSPYTYHALAPAALCTSYLLTDLMFQAGTGIEKVSVPLACAVSPLWAAGLAAAWYGPAFALTELMRRYRSSIKSENDKPSQWHYAGIGLIQGAIVVGFMLSHDFTQKDTFLSEIKAPTISSTLVAACFFTPGIIAGIGSCGDEQKAQRRKSKEHRIKQLQKLSVQQRYQMLLWKQLRETRSSSSAVAQAFLQEDSCKKKIYKPYFFNLKDSCSICLDPLDQTLQETKCKHTFCGQCLDTWLATNSTCPLCRTSIN